MPINPNITEKMLIRFNVLPAPMLEGFLYWMAGKAVLVAGKLGVFDALETSLLSIEELAEELTVSEKGVSVLLEVLESLGYVAKSGESYTNTKFSSKWLAKSSPDTVATFHSFL